MTDSLSSATFAQHLHSVFQVSREGAQLLALELVNVQDTSSPEFERFSLLFRGPMEPFLEQGIQELEHPTLGKLALFLVPMGPEQGSTGMTYEALFNRFRQ